MRAALPLLTSLAICGCGTHSKTLPFAEQRAICEGLLPQVEGAFACRLDELVPSSRMGSEPRYDVDALATFRADGHLDHFSELRASGPSADPTLGPADCAANAVRRLSVPPRADALVLPVRLQYLASGAVQATASVLPDGRCALLIPSGQ